MDIPRASDKEPTETALTNENIQKTISSTSRDRVKNITGAVEAEENLVQSSLQSKKEVAADIKKEGDIGSITEAWWKVTWDGPDDPSNPRNWSAGRKWLVTFVASSFAFIAPLSSSMISPALPAINAELHINNGAVELLVISIYVLGFAIGPLCLGPLSEIQAGGGTLGDVWSNEERGKAMGIYTLMPLLGPALGPIMAGFIVRYSDWRWCFYSVSIGDVFVQLISSLLLQETYPRIILAKKAKALRKATGNPDLMTEWEAEGQSLGYKLRTAFKRPIKLITTQPIVQCVAVYMAFLYGLIYLVLSTFPRLWTEKYHEDVHIGGLNYISVGLGFLTGVVTVELGGPNFAFR
ncbi:hypothetical protein N0V90_012050 [Kalmusia sp. IMI 367209]|nr:hypothetical protein N0V90_012050 [Kalmusia sp. IMI 367209]